MLNPLMRKPLFDAFARACERLAVPCAEPTGDFGPWVAAVVRPYGDTSTLLEGLGTEMVLTGALSDARGFDFVEEFDGLTVTSRESSHATLTSTTGLDLHLERGLLFAAFDERAEEIRSTADGTHTVHFFEAEDQRGQVRALRSKLARRERMWRVITEGLAEANAGQETRLQAAKDAAEAANRAKSEFLAHMSHELRTPLNGILGYAQILKRDSNLDEAQEKGIDVIRRSGEHLLTLIDDVLDLSKVEAGKLELEPSAFNLIDTLENVAEVAKVKAVQKGLQVEFQRAPELPLYVEGDERRLRQVLFNLIGNAVKFTNEGQISLVAAYEPGKEDRIRFEVRDTGIGIGKALHERIFLPFSQVHPSTVQAGGAGLGLSISRNLVELMGGVLEVESASGRGSVFRFSLRLPEMQNESANLPKLLDTRPQVGFVGSASRILVVDDNDENRAVLLRLLQPLGFEISEASSGADALKRLETFDPHLVILDLLMPEMDGFETLAAIRTSRRASVPVIALSSSVFEETRQRARDAGFSDFIPKPLRSRELFSKLRNHLNLRWIYERPIVPSTPDLPELLFEAPPAAELESLLAFAKQGHIRAVRDAIVAIEASDARYKPLADALRARAASMDMRGVRELVERHMER